ncbi:hypothetical protein HRbin26_02114 [bacterium HR26]|nr:hypothetical protein HRbin26_02114 [bacterium HR26]
MLERRDAGPDTAQHVAGRVGRRLVGLVVLTRLVLQLGGDSETPVGLIFGEPPAHRVFHVGVLGLQLPRGLRRHVVEVLERVEDDRWRFRGQLAERGPEVAAVGELAQVPVHRPLRAGVVPDLQAHAAGQLVGECLQIPRQLDDLGRGLDVDQHVARHIALAVGQPPAGVDLEQHQPQAQGGRHRQEVLAMATLSRHRGRDHRQEDQWEPEPAPVPGDLRPDRANELGEAARGRLDERPGAPPCHQQEPGGRQPEAGEPEADREAALPPAPARPGALEPLSASAEQRGRQQGQRQRDVHDQPGHLLAGPGEHGQHNRPPVDQQGPGVPAPVELLASNQGAQPLPGDDADTDREEQRGQVLVLRHQQEVVEPGLLAALHPVLAQPVAERADRAARQPPRVGEEARVEQREERQPEPGAKR